MKFDSIIKELGLNSLLKISHKKKTLTKTLKKHIEEIKEFSEILVQKHGLTELNIFLNELAEWHDIGKLNPTWCIDKDRNPPHSAFSAYLFLKYSLTKDPKLFYFILKHHSNLIRIPFNIPFIRKDIIGKIKYKIDQKEALKLILEKFENLEQSIEDIKDNINFIDLFGIFKTADILSAMFEENKKILEQDIDFKVVEAVKEKLQDYIKSKNLKFDENKWKIFTEIARTDENILLLAPTGWGKTFAALTVAVSKKPTHIIYVLPTITSIRKMKQSLQKLLVGIKVDENYYFADTEKLRKTISSEDDTNIDLDLFISKSFISPVTITTLDQLLLSFLPVGKYFLKRYHFRNSILIFDEFHLYPVNGLYILLHFLKKFNEEFNYNMKSIFMSATIHPEFKKLMNQFIALREYEFLREYKKKRRYLYLLEENDIASKKVLKQIIEKSKHGNVLVICNTVEKAIKVYLLIKYSYHMNNILLLHSRYTYYDRRNKEEQLEKLLSSKGFIFISTQVSEVSLDFSFDYLFTELAPIPSLIQRFGRVNRYSDFTYTTNVTITIPEELGKSRFYPYEEEEMKFAISALSELEHKIKSEFELVERLKDAPFLIDNVGLDESIKNYLKKLEERTKYFFSIDLKEEELNKLLKFRDTNTALIIPENFTTSVLELLLSDKKYKFQLVKEYFTPVPIWWFFEKSAYVYREKNLLFLSSQRFLYSQELGYFDLEKLQNFVEIIKHILTKCNNNNLA